MGDLVPQTVVSRSIEHDDGTGTGTGAISGISVPYCKWLIAPPSRAEGGGATLRQEANGRSLPPGYAFSRLRRDELKLTIARTEIPKTEDTLAQLGSAGVRYAPKSTAISTSTSTSTSTVTAAEAEDAEQGELTAWAFLGVDGSLTSLHVEPEHRGQGLAQAVSRRLFQTLADDASALGFRAVEGPSDGVGEYGRGEGWATSDVAEDNVGSAGVARGLGGKEGWRVRWVGVNLAAVLER